MVHFNFTVNTLIIRRAARWVDSGCDTAIHFSGPNNHFQFTHTLGNRPDAFQVHKDVVVYGSMPSNRFEPAKVKIRDYSFANGE